MTKLIKCFALALIVLITLSVQAEETIVQDDVEISEDFAREFYVSFYFSWDGNEVRYGDVITLVPVLHGYDGLNYSLKWQHSADDSNWIDWSGDSYVITEDNSSWYWRLVVTTEIEE